MVSDAVLSDMRQCRSCVYLHIVVWVPDANLLSIGDSGPTLDVARPDQTLRSLEDFVPEEWGLPPYGEE